MSFLRLGHRVAGTAPSRPQPQRAAFGSAIWTTWAAALGLLAIVAARQPQVLLGPYLWAEDGTVWLPDALSHSFLRNLRTPHTGYLQTFSRIVAEGASVLPLTWAPWILVAAAIIALMLPIAIVWRRAPRLGLGQGEVLTIAALYLLLPYSHETYVNLTNGQWRLALAVLAIFLLPRAASRIGMALDISVVALSAVSGPLSLLALPVHALLAWRQRCRWKLILWIVSGLGAAVQLTMLSNTSGRVGGPPHWDAQLGLRLLGGQIGIGALLGTRGAAMVDGQSWAPLAWGAALLLLLGLTVVTYRAYVPWIGPPLLLSGIIVTSALIAGTSEEPGRTLVELGTPPAGGRYWLLPILTVHLAILAVWRKGKSRPERVFALVLASIAALGIGLDFRLPGFPAEETHRALATYESAPPGEVVRVPLAPPPWEARWIKPGDG